MTDRDRTGSTDPEDDEAGGSDRSLAPLMGAVYVVAGIAHFLVPQRFAEAVPPAFPRPVGLVYLSGIAEILLGIGVAIPRTRRPSAWGLAALLVAVLPADLPPPPRAAAPPAARGGRRGRRRGAPPRGAR